MESLGKIFKKKLLWKPRRKDLDSEKVLTLKQEPREKKVRVFDSKAGTKNRTKSEKLVSPRYSWTIAWEEQAQPEDEDEDKDEDKAKDKDMDKDKD